MGKHTRRLANLLAALLLGLTVAVLISAMPVPTAAEELDQSLEEKVVTPPEDARYSSGEMLVVFQEGTSDDTIANVIQEAETADPSGEMVDEASGELDGSYVLDTPMDEVVVSVVIDEGASFEEAAAEIAASENVVYVQPNFIYVLNEAGGDEAADAGHTEDDAPGESLEDAVLEDVGDDPEIDASAAAEDAADETGEEPALEEEEGAALIDAESEQESAGLQIESLETEGLEAEASGSYVDVGLDDPFAVAGSETRNNWHLGAIDAATAWSLIDQGDAATVTVAVVDTGCDLEHVDLVDNLDRANAYQAVSNSGTAFSDNGVSYTSTVQAPGQLTASFGTRGDINGHGTHVCGIIGATAGNGQGVAGVSRNSAKVLPINIFNTATSSSGDVVFTADTATVIGAYTYLFDLVDNDQVANLCAINMSIGGYGDENNDKAMESVINTALNEYGILTVVSGGNAGTTANSWPSDYEACIAVAAIQQSGWDSDPTHAPYSDANSAKDIAAPGGMDSASRGILSTLPNDSYGEKYGTSMAAPMVSGTLALMFAANPQLDAETARSVLYSSAMDILDEGFDDRSGHGLVQAGAAVGAASAITPSYSIGDCTVSSIPSQTFTGSALEPPVTVRHGTRQLVAGADYTIAYADNTAAGTATATITGKGRYFGTITTTFSIVAASAENTSGTDRPLADGIYLIESDLQAGMLVDVSGESRIDGGNIISWRSNGGANQQFQIVWDASANAYSIQSVNSGLMLDVEGERTKSGTNVIQWTSHGGRNQRWIIAEDGTGYQIRSALDQNLTLTVDAPYAQPNTNVAVKTRKGSANQRFHFLSASEAPAFTASWATVADGIYTIAPAHAPAMRLDIWGASAANGAPLIMWTDNGGRNQQFQITFDANAGYYRIVPMNSGKRIDVSGISTKDGTDVLQWSANRGMNQYWDIQQRGDGYVLVSALKPDLVLDVEGESTKAGAHAIVWTDHDGANQRFTLIAVE